MYYFGYGMNTNKKQMTGRCPASVSLGAAKLPEHIFEFRVHADVREESGVVADGVLWKITDTCLAALDILEGYPHYYDRKTVQVEHPELGVVEALVYYMTDQEHLAPPHDSYYDMLIEGYTEHEVSTDVIVDAAHEAELYQFSESFVEDY